MAENKAAQAAQTPASATDKYHRVRLAIPKDDVWVKQWIDEQQSPSVSIRALIRHYIETYGYGDMFSRPVEKLPRRGRPPGSGISRTEESESESAEMTEVDSQGSPGADDSGADEVSEPTQSSQKQVPAKPAVSPAQMLDGENDDAAASSVGSEMLSDFD